GPRANPGTARAAAVGGRHRRPLDRSRLARSPRPHRRGRGGIAADGSHAARRRRQRESGGANRMSADAGNVAELRTMLERYDTALLRQVADTLLHSRLQRARDDLIDKLVEAAGNAAVIDRRLQALDEPQRGLLALLGLGRRAQWELSTVLELLACLGAAD